MEKNFIYFTDVIKFGKILAYKIHIAIHTLPSFQWFLHENACEFFEMYEANALDAFDAL